jgi:hypothetical protein
MQVDIVLAFCWPVIGKEWIAGMLYAHGTAPSLDEVYGILEDQPRTGSCALPGLVLQWSQKVSDQFIRARWTLCTESEYKQQAAAKAAELASASSGEETATTAVEEVVQLQFFHPLFRKYDGACEYLQALLQCLSTGRTHLDTVC